LLAQKGSLAYILVSELRKLSTIYRFSLAFFVQLFKKCLQPPALAFSSMSQKIEVCEAQLYKIVFSFISTSLFKQDRLVFGLHLTHGLFPAMFSENEWEFFLGNNVQLELETATAAFPQ